MKVLLLLLLVIGLAAADAWPGMGRQSAGLGKRNTAVCYEGPAKGPCMGYFPRYYYDSATSTCKIFIYGGCQGNGNNFERLDDCKRACGVPKTERLGGDNSVVCYERLHLDSHIALGVSGGVAFFSIFRVRKAVKAE
ncbi:kunitz-type serine protease inhibitor bitisilin-2-like [Ornithodoros turicata]|uniref:kunitz-type serine protease inhibitor bitisilin-2-like n=1 Tax=Ornithodoros turicata TaxID=34597 RepID=UPI003139DB5D